MPSTAQLAYQVPYAPLVGADVSPAFSSVLHISFEVRAGLLIRQMHHWTALVFVSVAALHMCRVVFTAAFRRPRDRTWIIGIGLLLLALAEGFTGYSLPDDLLSGTGLRITYSAVLSIPFVGPALAFLIFGGEFPTSAMIGRLFVFHIMLLPGLFIAAIGEHAGLKSIQKHTMLPGRGVRTDRLRAAVLARPGLPVAGTAVPDRGRAGPLRRTDRVNPVWLYGPFVPSAATLPAQPDWYVGWLEGALRLGPPFEPTVFGVTIRVSLHPGHRGPWSAVWGVGPVAVPGAATSERSGDPPRAAVALAGARSDRHRLRAPHSSPS